MKGMCSLDYSVNFSVGLKFSKKKLQEWGQIQGEISQATNREEDIAGRGPTDERDQQLRPEVERNEASGGGRSPITKAQIPCKEFEIFPDSERLESFKEGVGMRG